MITVIKPSVTVRPYNGAKGLLELTVYVQSTFLNVSQAKALRKALNKFIKEAEDGNS